MKSFGNSKNEWANMPQEVVHKNIGYGKAINSEIDDTITGIDEVVEHGQGKIRKTPSYQK